MKTNIKDRFGCLVQRLAWKCRPILTTSGPQCCFPVHEKLNNWVGSTDTDRPLSQERILRLKRNVLVNSEWYFGRQFVKRFAVFYRPIVLSITLVYCGQTVGWIKMKLGSQVGLEPGHIVLDGTKLLHPTPKGHTVPNFRPMFIVAKRLNASGYHLVRRWASAYATLC